MGRRPAGERGRSGRRAAVYGLLLLIFSLGAFLRVYLVAQYRPALLGYPDTLDYVLDARNRLFAKPFRVSGYAIFLRMLHFISHGLALVPITQHLLGLGAGVLLFDATRRARLPAGLGLLPAAVVMLGGSQIIIEHEVLSDALFLFLVDLTIWFIVRAWNGSRWWSLLAGLGIGVASIVRTVGLGLIPVVLLFLLLAPPDRLGRPSDGSLAAVLRGRRREGGSRRRSSVKPPALALCAGVIGLLAVTVPFMYAHSTATGSWGFASTSNFQLYGRVAPWADCSQFTPPPGTARLCIHTPVANRQGSQVWLFTKGSPAVRAYGFPDVYRNRSENSQLRSFAIAAILGQPITYLRYIVLDLARVVTPTAASSPYPRIGNSGYGLGPDAMNRFFFDTAHLANAERILDEYYSPVRLHPGNVSLVVEWDRLTRLDGPLMIIVLILTAVAPFAMGGLPRRFALLCALVAAVEIVLPVLTLGYDWRYMVPSFGPLVAAASVGGLGVFRVARQRFPAFHLAR